MDFGHFARWCAEALGSPTAFAMNCLLILMWLASGPYFQYSDTWQLVVNTVTTVFTYLAVFLIQNTQNRDAKAMHLKLSELIVHLKGARNQLVNLEDMTDEQLAALHKQFLALKERRSLPSEGGQSPPAIEQSR